MFGVVITEKGGAQRRTEFSKNEVTIGRVQGNDIILPKGNVSKRHSRIVFKDERFIVVDLKSTNGTYVNGRKITSPLVVRAGDKIYIGDFILTIEETASESANNGASPPQAVAAPAAPAPPAPAQAPPAAPPAAPVAAPVEKPSIPPELPSTPTGKAAGNIPAEAVGPSGSTEHSQSFAGDHGAIIALAKLLEADVDLDELSAAGSIDEADIKKRIDQLGAAHDDAVKDHVLQEAVGLGPLQALIDDGDVHEVVVHGHDYVRVSRDAGLVPANFRFSSERALKRIARRLAERGGHAFDEDNFAFSGVLPNGACFSVLLPPLSARGVVIEITNKKDASFANLVKRGFLDQAASDTLVGLVSSGKNVLVTGPLGSGVTAMLSAIASGTAGKHVVTVGASAEVCATAPGLISLTWSTVGEPKDVMRRAASLRSDYLIIDDVYCEELRLAWQIALARTGTIVGAQISGGISGAAAGGLSQSDLKAAFAVVVELDPSGSGIKQAHTL